MKKTVKRSDKLAAVFNRSFFIFYLALSVLVGGAGLVTVAVFGELGTEYPMPVPTVILRFAALLFCFAALTALFVFCFRFLQSDKLRRLDRRRFNTAVIFGCAALLLAVQLVFAFLLRMKPITDIERLELYARRIVADDSFACLNSDDPELNHYIIRYQNNLPYLLFITLIHKITYSLTGGFSQIPLIVISTLCINASMLMTLLVARRLFGERKAVLTLLLCALFTPYYTYTAYYYTDSFSIPFVIGTIYTLVAALQSGSRRKKAVLLLICGALCCVGFKMKGSVAIMVPALLIYMPMRYGFKRAAKMCGVFLLSFCVLLGGFNLAIKRSKLISEEQSDRYQFPAAHWVMLGLNDKGAFTFEDSRISESFPTKQERLSGELREIGRRISGYGFFGIIVHAGYKLVWTYMDGTYYIANYLAHFRHRTPLHSFILYEGRFRFAFFAYSFGFQIMLLVMIALSGLKARRERRLDVTTLFRIILTGMVLFFMIWETNARYPFNFTPLYMLLATDGLDGFSQSLKARKRDHGAVMK